MTTPTLTITDRVNAGAAWLDEHRPGWWQRINLDTLDLGDPCHCVLGQEYAPDVAGYFTNGYQIPVTKWLYDGGPSASALGFAAPLPAAWTEQSWEQLTAAWRELILARRAGTETTR